MKDRRGEEGDDLPNSNWQPSSTAVVPYAKAEIGDVQSYKNVTCRDRRCSSELSRRTLSATTVGVGLPGRESFCGCSVQCAYQACRADECCKCRQSLEAVAEGEIVVVDRLGAMLNWAASSAPTSKRDLGPVDRNGAGKKEGIST